MTLNMLEQLASGLPAGDPYDRWAFSPGAVPSGDERVEKARGDLAFGANIARLYGVRALPLPPLDWPETIRRAYRSWSTPGSTDDELVLAETFTLPANAVLRPLICSLSICEDGTAELIADCFQCTPQTITLATDLFLNVRDRRSEPFFLRRLIRNEHWTAPSSHPYFGRELIELAIRKRKTQVVLSHAKIVRAFSDTVTIGTLLEQIVLELLRHAKMGLSKGLSTPEENPAVALLLKYKLLNGLQCGAEANDPLSGFQLRNEDLRLLDEDLRRRSQLASHGITPASGTQLPGGNLRV